MTILSEAKPKTKKEVRSLFSMSELKEKPYVVVDLSNKTIRGTDALKIAAMLDLLPEKEKDKIKVSVKISPDASVTDLENLKKYGAFSNEDRVEMSGGDFSTWARKEIMIPRVENIFLDYHRINPSTHYLIRGAWAFPQNNGPFSHIWVHDNYIRTYTGNGEDIYDATRGNRLLSHEFRSGKVRIENAALAKNVLKKLDENAKVDVTLKMSASPQPTDNAALRAVGFIKDEEGFHASQIKAKEALSIV
ncbi:MAG: hypothetical protein JSS34_01050 [Proteobacteria bacterium]|nr:hypothetical protein [Pseudomonadota bacterium]